MDMKIKRITSILLILILIISFVAIYNIAFATEEVVEGQIEEVQSEEASIEEELEISGVPDENLVTGTVHGARAIRTYSHAGARGGKGSGGTSITDINTVVNYLNKHSTDANDVLRYYASIFCLWHDSAITTYHGTLSRDWKSNIDVSSYITLNWDAGTSSISKSKFDDIKEYGDFTSQTTRTNIEWKAFQTDMKTFSTPKGSYSNTNVFVYAAAFSQKRSYLSGNYGKERAQIAFWAQTNNETKNDLWKSGKALDAYESQVDSHGSTPNVTVGNQVGTVLLGDNPSNYKYKIGPFNMSDYAYLYASCASGYSGALMGGITSGKITLNNGTQIAIDGSSCKIEYSNYGDNNRSGTIKVGDYTEHLWGAPSGYKYPWPNSVFYITVDKSLCGDATTLNKVEFTYQSTRAEGSGWVLKSKYVRTTWKKVDERDNSETYYCRELLCGDGCYGYSSWHNYGNARNCTAHCKGSRNYCRHGVWNGHHTNTCSRCTCDGKDVWVTTYTTDSEGNSVPSGGYWRCTHSHDYCSTGYCPGVKYNGDHGTHRTTYTCQHGYTWCQTFNWEANMVVQDDQPFMAVNSANVYVEESDTRADVYVRLTTDVSIDKYITKVEHLGETGIIFGENENRANKTTADKNNDSIKVERGDRVTFKIVLKNWQNEEVKFKVRDILPENYGYTINPSINDWIVIPASGQYDIKVTVDVKDITGTHNNTVKLLTRNRGNTGSSSDSVDYPRTTSRSGPVVNIAELEGRKIEDADYFTIKEYNTSVDKNIVEVKHLGNDEIIYSGNSRKNIDESSKSNSPVYVEYGDKVTYEIDIYNTTSPYESNRNGSPYWDPDKVYVDIEDTLPKKYTDLNISVSNGTGTIRAVSGGKVKIDDILVPKNGKTTVTVSLVVEEHDKAVKEENNVKIVGDVLNINRREIKNNPAKDKTSDFYHMNDYNLSIYKYISEYDKAMTKFNNDNRFTNETVNITDRYPMTEEEKENRPLAVEKTEKIVYSLRLNNDSKSESKGLPSGIKRATSVRPTDVTDVLDYGLTYKSVYAKAYKTDGSDKYGNLPVSVSSMGNNTYKFSLPNTSKGEIIILEPGEYLIYYVTVQITETNMYLFELSNMGSITTLTDINNTNDKSRIVKNDRYNENIASQQTSRDFVKLKDLVISGKVWLDTDKDGYIGKDGSGKLNSYIDYESNPSTNITPPSGDTEYAMKGITVKLYSVETDKDGNNTKTTLVRTTKTNSDGLFTFGKKEDGISWYNGTYSYDGSAVESEQRIPKATNKDANLNYQTSSEYIQYYIEYEYDGVAFKSTEIYSGTKNLNNDGSLNSNKYKIDSNADEFTKTRNEYDKKYEIIGYNKAYNGQIQNKIDIAYQKAEHNSYLKVDSDNRERVMTARSFIIETDATKLINDCKAAMNSCGAARWKECVNHWQNWKGLIDSGYFDESQFPNTTQGRLQAQAYLKTFYNEVMQNISNQGGNTQITKYLWLFKPAVENDKPETEYLKYINLGLEEREDVDLSVTQDVYEVKNTVNGESMTYWYNQNKFVKDGSSVDHDDTNTEAFNTEFYMTGFKDNKSALTPYEFKYYLSDYNYRYSSYTIKTVEDYKTKDSELVSEITFRIKVTNNAITNDEPHLSSANQDIKVYTGINEIIEYFDSELMNVTYNGDGTVQTINVKTKDENGYLVDTPLKIADAKFVLPNGNTIPAEMVGLNTSNNPATLGDTSLYNDKRNLDGYNVVYIRPSANLTANAGKDDPIAKDVILAEGENVDILIKFIVDKDDSRNVKLGLKTAVAEVGAYSTYYQDVNGKYYAAGLVDKDSNPGNFGETYNGTSFDSRQNNKADDPYLKYYEDDTYKTGIELKKEDDLNQNPILSPRPPVTPGEREIEGQVWDDARSEIAKTTDGNDTTDGAQYIGDGKNGTLDGVVNSSANDKAKLNTVLKNNDGTLKEKNDFSVEDVGVKLVELVKVPVYDDSGNLIQERIYEETIKVNNSSVVEMRTDENGKYALSGFIPGEYIVKFFYGDTVSEQMLIFNGQDYKSTTYQAGSEYADSAYIAGSTDGLGNLKKDTDKVLEILEKKGLSDAKDDEIRRLEVISFSETLNNSKTLILRGKNSNNKELQKDKTSMDAETVDFLVRTEKYKKNKTTLTYAETMDKINSEERHPTQNIDFGLQYRPEQQVALNKFVKNITITTSDSNVGVKQNLVDAKFNEYYGVVVNTNLETGVTTFLGYKTAPGNDYETIRIPETYLDGNVQNIKDYVTEFLSEYGMTVSNLNVDNLDKCVKNQDGTYQVLIAGTDLDTENSIGLSNLQYVPNTLDTHDEDSLQGFIYMNIDDEIMQGAEIKIEYLFTGSNISEIDRVSNRLSVLRFKENNETKAYYENASEESYNAIRLDAMRAGGTLTKENEGEIVSLVTTQNEVYGGKNEYSGALTARNDLFNDYYRYEVTSTEPSEARAVRDDENNRDVIYRIKPKTIGDTTDNYYGKYLGTTYYTGKVGENDIVAELKLNKILDYVDNNLVFKQEDNTFDSIDHFWSSTTSSELVLSGYIDSDVLEFEQDSDKESYKNIDSKTKEALISAIQIYSDKVKLQDYLDSQEDIDSDIAKVKDYTNIIEKGLLLDSKGVSYTTSQRSNLALMQDLRTNDYQTEGEIANADMTKFLTPRDSSDDRSFGKVKIITSKVISAQDDTAEMSYENIGEIIECSSVTGRVTNLNTTLGNVKITNPERNPNNSPEYEDGKKESDTASVEKITLTPPTGLNRTSTLIRRAVESASYVGIVMIIVLVAVFGTFGVMKFYRKRKIK